jgi:hypothetical protein
MSIPDMRGVGRRRRRRWLIAGLAVVSSTAAVLALSVGPALAVHDTGAFELDGNATNNPAVPGDDWDNVCHQVTGSDCSTTNDTNGATAVDWISEPNVNTTIFTGGGSKDPLDINNWAWKDGAGGLPAKDNLLHSFAARYTLPSTGSNTGTCPSGSASTCQVLYFGSDRLDNSGDAQQGFWFFQNQIGLTGTGSGTFTGVHKNGDLLVVSDFSIGGTTSIISVFEWNTACTKAGVTVGGLTCADTNLLQLATSNNANCASAGTGDQFCGIVNTNTITMPWSFTDKSGTPNNQALNGEFYEGGVNLSTLGLADRCFQSVESETRSSTATSATLKDFILGNFGSCKTTVKTTPTDASGNPVPAGGFSIGTGSVSVADQANVTVSGVATWSGSVQFSLCGPSATGCTSGGTTIGSPVPIDNTTSQPISSPTATVTSVGTYCWRGDFTPSAASQAAGVSPGSDGSSGECFTVNPVKPTLATSAGAGPVLLGSPISDTATLTGTANEPGTPVINPTTAGSPAGGTITFTAFGPNDCSTVAFTTTRAVSGDGTYPTASQAAVSFTPTAVGTYHWAASYNGDPPNTLGTDHNLTCTDTNEDVVVQSVPSSMTSHQSFIPNDSATVTAPAGGNLSGSVTFKVYESTDCSGPAIFTQTVAVSGPASGTTVQTTNTTVSTTAANVSWLVSFDSTNTAQQSISAKCFEKSALSIDNDGTVSSP